MGDPPGWFHVDLEKRLKPLAALAETSELRYVPEMASPTDVMNGDQELPAGPRLRALAGEPRPAAAVAHVTHNFMDLPLAAHGAKIRPVALGFVEPAGANRVTLADGRTAAPGRPQGGRLRVRHSQASASPIGGCGLFQNAERF
jgi:hypothetical protein